MKLNKIIAVFAFIAASFLPVVAAAYDFEVENLKKIPFDEERFERINDKNNARPTIPVVVNTDLRGIHFSINNNNTEDIEKIAYVDEGYILYLPVTAFTLTFRGTDYKSTTIGVKGARALELTLTPKGINPNAFKDKLIVNFFIREPFDLSSRIDADGDPVLRINTDIPFSRILSDAFNPGVPYELLTPNDSMSPYYFIFEEDAALDKILNPNLFYKNEDGTIVSLSNSPLRNVVLKKNRTYYIDITDSNGDGKRPQRDKEEIKRRIAKFKRDRKFF